MLIQDVIQRVKDYATGIDFETGNPLDSITTKDQVLYGSANQECTGIVTCIWATSDVIRAAEEQGANLIIAHEALFWNHGDRTGWLAFNKTFQLKKALLDDWGGCVWRYHDYIHSKVPIGPDGAYVDGIFYGLAAKLGWTDYIVDDEPMPMDYEIPQMRAEDLARYLVEKLGLRGTRLIGDPDTPVRRIHLPMHCIGGPDNEELRFTEENDVDCLITMEFTDFTVSEYIRDSAMLGRPKAAITIGHFNTEEPGMEHMLTWLPQLLGNAVPVIFVPAGDPYRYIA